MLLAVAGLKELDDWIEDDFQNYPPPDIPKNNEWQRTGLGDYFFNSDKKEKAQRRSVFNFGVMTGLAEHYFDGKPTEFDKFLKKAAMSGIHFPKMVMKSQSFAQKYPREFSIGVGWSNEFRKRRNLP